MFKEEHFTLFRHHGFMWPPELSDGMMLEHDQICLHGLTVRQAELIVFCHTKWPPGDSKMDFLDANPTLAFLVRYKNENADQVYNPWHFAPKTLVGSSCIAVRMKADDGNSIRPLFAWEYFPWWGGRPACGRLARRRYLPRPSAPSFVAMLSALLPSALCSLRRCPLRAPSRLCPTTRPLAAQRLRLRQRVPIACCRRVRGRTTT